MIFLRLPVFCQQTVSLCRIVREVLFQCQSEQERLNWSWFAWTKNTLASAALIKGQRVHSSSNALHFLKIAHYSAII
jgi:hypothetical protein